MVSEDTDFLASGRYRDGSMVRFYQDQWQTIGGWESLTTDLLTGVCRNVFSWSDANSVLNVAFGTHSNLQVWQGGALYDITPFMPPTTLGADPFSVTNGSATVTVTHAAHGLTTGDSVIISGATDTGGILAANLNGTRTVTVTDVDHYTFTAGAAASSTTTGGGSAVVISPQVVLPPGAINGTGAAGYGTGTYGTGTYGTAPVGEYFPRTWSLASYETGDLYACPRGSTIFRWQQNTANRAVALTNAPRQVTAMLSVPQRQIMALGCSRSLDGVFDPLCIRWSDIENPTVWTEATNNNAGEYVLNGSGRIVGGIVLGNYVLVLTDVTAYLGTYVGDPGETWRFEPMGDNCGLIGVNAITTGAGNTLTAVWVSPDVNFWSYSLGGAPTPIDSPIRQAFADNLATGQGDKIVAATVAQYGEVRWFYPDERDPPGYEVSRDITLSKQGWCVGRLARTAFVDAGPNVSPIGVTYDGNAYWHERGNSADGAPITGFIETTGFYADEAERGLKINGVWPDIKSQTGALNLTVYSRDYPQGTEHTHGPYVLSPGLPKKSFRCSGRVIRLRIDFSASPTFARCGKLEFDAAPIGGR